ncbi:MAG: hypothetical protein NTV43_10480 [Methylococcales bacterium]|nr:hypothetical protein [Methylococcales bacterium]
MKKVIFALIILGVAIWYKQSNSGAGTDQTGLSASDRIGKAVLNSALQVADLDASILLDVSEKLKKSCAKNRYGLSESECVDTIDERNEICTQDTAQAFPGQIADADKMQSVVAHFVDCLFEKK